MLRETLDLDSQSNTFTTSYDTYGSICRRLVTKIIFYNNQSIVNTGFSYKRIYISNSILNILSDSSSFFVNPLQSNIDFDENRPIGKIADIDVYLKEHISKNHIIFSHEISEVRNSKINSILEDSDVTHLEELILEIKSEFI